MRRALILLAALLWPSVVHAQQAQCLQGTVVVTNGGYGATYQDNNNGIWEEVYVDVHHTYPIRKIASCGSAHNGVVTVVRHPSGASAVYYSPDCRNVGHNAGSTYVVFPRPGDSPRGATDLHTCGTGVCLTLGTTNPRTSRTYESPNCKDLISTN